MANMVKYSYHYDGIRKCFVVMCTRRYPDGRTITRGLISCQSEESARACVNHSCQNVMKMFKRG